MTFRALPETLSRPTDDAGYGVQSPAHGTDSCTDEALLLGLRAQDRTALVVLFRRYTGIVRGIAVRILQDEGEAEDLLQELFLFIFHKASVFDPAKGNARSWIISMTYQMALQRRRYLKHRNFYTAADFDPEQHASMHAVTESVSLQQIDGRELLRKHRACLRVEQQQILNLHFFEGYDFREIAATTGQPLQTVRSHYYRALKRLRAEFIAHGIFKA